MRGVYQKAGKGGSWWIRWTCPQGHRHEEKVEPKAAAQTLVERRRVAVKVDGFCLTKDRTRDVPPLFSEAAKNYLAWAVRDRPRSVRFRQSHLAAALPTLGLLSVADITPTRIEQYLAVRQHAGATGATINRDRAVLSHLFGQLVAKGTIPRNPVARVARAREAVEEPRPLTHDEEARLLMALDPTETSIAQLALNTGLRLGEIRAQAWRDVDLEARALTVTSPKSGLREVIPLNLVALDLLARLPKDGPTLFPTMRANFSRLFAKKARSVKVLVTFHCLRDTFISRLAPHVSGPVLMQLARHRDFRTTTRYLKIDGQHLREAVAKLVEADDGRSRTGRDVPVPTGPVYWDGVV